jgi:hypothetical protein
VDQKTIDHRRVAARNRDLARTLLAPAQAGLEPAPWEWVAVILFYSAVHYVNAYLWEQYHLTPRNHGDRTYGVQQDLAISGCAQSYDDLKDVGFHARYSENLTVSERTARMLLQVRLRDVEATVMQALGQPVPVW